MKRLGATYLKILKIWKVIKNLDEKHATYWKPLFFKSGSIYLDHAGTTLYSQSQLKAAFGDLSSNCYGNPHSRSPSSRLTEDLVEQARVQALHFFRADPEEYQLIFTSGATASLKLVAESFAFNTTQTHGRPGSFVYLKESHTSVVGMRESSISRGISTFILTLDEAEELFKEGSDRSCWDREIEKVSNSFQNWQRVPFNSINSSSLHNNR